MKPPPSAPLLELRGLRSRLAGPFDLGLDPGECVAITGPSGAGKSLFLRMIADLDPSEGEVRLHGRERHSWPAPAWRRQVLYNAAEPAWWCDRICDHFTASDRERAHELVPLLDLPVTLFAAPVTQLSTGERLRMALIRAVAAEPAVLLLDEPTASLDQDSTALVEELLADRLAGGTAILLVTHNLQQARRVASRQVRMTTRQFERA
ncbi:MAG TPA: ATP-binding cassette domain-containing protein [Acetobacteraceae bacterium]|nr:ATP-binding cassette domain-containing protein [Acetobacteraceae bacterium]